MSAIGTSINAGMVALVAVSLVGTAGATVMYQDSADELRAENEELRAENEELRAQLNATRSDLEDAREQVVALERRLETRTRDVDRVTSELERTEGQLSATERELEEELESDLRSLCNKRNNGVEPECSDYR